MVIIIEDKLKLKDIHSDVIIVIPILSDILLHPVVNTICVVGISTPTDLYVIPINHSQARCLSVDDLIDVKFQVAFTPNKKITSHMIPFWECADMASIEYLDAGKITIPESFLTLHHRKMYERFDGYPNVNTSVALMKHVEFLETYSTHLWLHSELGFRGIQFNPSSEPYKFLNEVAIPALTFIEKSGLQVDENLIEQHLSNRTQHSIQHGKVYSEYNLYTTTGRCSNKFAGLNFAALNKSDGIREIFKSRFENGVLVNADFESFHLRLIADMIDYQFPLDIPVHEYLGRQYFNKTVLTPEEYEESKKITFRLLYGENRDSNIPEFFNKVYDYVDMLMVLIQKQEYIISPYYHRRIYKDNIEDPTPQKIFNYIIQLAETELNLTSVCKLQPLFQGKQSKPILYTYDSLLFDFCLDDGKEFMKDVIQVLSHNGKFPMRVSYGANYHDLKRFEL
jgi:hypothetical protein